MLNTKANSKKLLSTKDKVITTSNYESNIKRYKSQDVYQVGKRKFETKENINNIPTKVISTETCNNNNNNINKSPSKINNYISNQPKSNIKSNSPNKKIVNDESIQEQINEEENSKNIF